MKTPTRDPILDLVSAMNRAKESGLTDGDNTRRDSWFVLLNKLKDVCDEAHSETEEEKASGEKLITGDILTILAALSGWYIGTYSSDINSEFITMAKFADEMIRSTKNAHTAKDIIRGIKK